MKKYCFLVVILLCIACKKNKCTDAVVTLKTPTACRDTSLIINGVAYRTDNLPAAFAIEGKHICIDYSLYGDFKMCPCCGGTIVHITGIH